MRTRTAFSPAAIALVAAAAACVACAAEPPPPANAWVFACDAENDLYRAVAAAAGAECRRFSTAAEAVGAAAEGAAVLVLADGYPDRPAPIEPATFDEAARKRLRLYVEYPERLPDLTLGAPRDVRFERGVIASDFFGAELRPGRIVLVSGCRYLPAASAAPHIVIAKVAGVDTAVYGIDGAAAPPLLFDHPRGNLLVATTSLSRCVRGRYLPAGAWRTIWRTILARLRPGAPAVLLDWTPAVRPSFGPDEALPGGIELQAVRRAADWIVRSRVLRHRSWPADVLDRSKTYNTVRAMPLSEWPAGDGSFGVLEGFSSTILSDGGQPMRYAVRNDCSAEVAMLMAFDAAVNARPAHARIAANLIDYIFGDSGLAGGPRADERSPSYGLVGWSLDSPDSYWGDDNARALLAVGAAAALSGERRWEEAAARCILANFRTTGVSGFREACIQEAQLGARGWRAYWNDARIHCSPHFQAWLWACNFWAYRQTRFEPLLARSLAGLRAMMDAYPARWEWCLRSGTIERARLVLPLAWLVRVADTPEHRGWLRTVAGDLAALQDRSGALRETIGDGGQALPSNDAYGTGETSLIQRDGDTIADFLYSCNFALIGLREAAAATGDAFYAEAEERLARFACRAQARSEAHPELDGAWYRAFDFGRWEFWASSADWEWGPWCQETGWTQPWIAAALALRCRGTSLWDLLAKVDLGTHFERLRPRMLPDDAIAAAAPSTVTHGALHRPARLAAAPDARYPAEGAASLTDGKAAAPNFRAAGWLGFHGGDLNAVIDLGGLTDVAAVAVRCLQSADVGIYLPLAVEVFLSPDGRDFSAAHIVERIEPVGDGGPFARTLRVTTGARSARYVRVRAVNIAAIPAGRPAAGQPAWLFVDEILVNP